MNLQFNFDSATLPVVINVSILMIVALIIFIARLYNKIIKYKYNRSHNISRRIIRVTFFSSALINLILNFIVFVIISKKDTFSSLRIFTQSLAGEYLSMNVLKISNLFYVDAFSAFSSLLMSCIVVVSTFMALIDKKNKLSPTKTAFFIMTAGSLSGVFYSNDLFALLFFVVALQIGVAGLYRGIPAKPAEIKESFLFYFARMCCFVMMLSGVELLWSEYRVSKLLVLSSLLKPGIKESVAFICLTVPMTFTFFKHTLYIRDEACRCYFRMVAQMSLFVIFRIIFMLYGAMPGLERVSYIFISLGMLGTILASMLAFHHNDPEVYSEDIELYMKSTLFISLGVSMTSLYSAEAMAKYGLIASEATISMWMLYIPLSAMFTIICIVFKRKEHGLELWQYGDVVAEHPWISVISFCATFSMVGLPPFVGYVGRQFLYRAINNFNSMLMIFVFFTSLIILIGNIRFFSGILFRRRIRKRYARRINAVHSSVLPMSVLVVMLVVATMFPGGIFKKCLSPASGTLINRECCAYSDYRSVE